MKEGDLPQTLHREERGGPHPILHQEGKDLLRALRGGGEELRQTLRPGEREGRHSADEGRGVGEEARHLQVSLFLNLLVITQRSETLQILIKFNFPKFRNYGDFFSTLRVIVSRTVSISIICFPAG